MKIPKLAKGHKRQWIICLEDGCYWVGFYDFVPYSLSNPIMTTGCGHSAGRPWNEAVDRITEESAMKYIELNEVRARRDLKMKKEHYRIVVESAEATVLATVRVKSQRKVALEHIKLAKSYLKEKNFGGAESESVKAMALVP